MPNSLIPLMGKGFDPDSFSAALFRGAQMRRLQDQSQLEQDELSEKLASRNALVGLFQGGKVDQGRLEALMQSNPAVGLEIQKLISDQEYSTARSGKAKTDLSAAQFDLIGKHLSAARDNPTRENILANLDPLDAAGIPTADMRAKIEKTPDQGLFGLIQARSISFEKEANLRRQQQTADSMAADRQTRIGLERERVDIARANAAGAESQRQWARQNAAAGGGGGGKEYEFDRTMQAAGIQPGSPEYVKAARIKARLEEGAGGGQGIEMSYDSEGRPVVNIGGRGVKLTEQQAKNVINATAAEQAQAEMDRLLESGFDPTSASGAAQVMAADLPFVGGLVSEAAQGQNAANLNLGAALGYARSGMALTEIEIENTKKALVERYGDKPDVSAYKRNARMALIDAIKAGSPNVRGMVNEVLARAGGGGGSGRAEGGGGVDSERAELERLRALKAARSAGP